jgi:hypothetical protein
MDKRLEIRSIGCDQSERVEPVEVVVRMEVRGISHSDPIKYPALFNTCYQCHDWSTYPRKTESFLPCRYMSDVYMI